MYSWCKVIAIGNGDCNMYSNPCISHRAKTVRQGMNPINPLSSMGKL